MRMRVLVLFMGIRSKAIWLQAFKLDKRKGQ